MVGPHSDALRSKAMIFVSHAFDDKDDYLNIADALKAEGIDHFEPDSLIAGHSLQLKLREAIARCSGCIFVATRRSVRSPWCLAELGAFWGADKPVIIYLADHDLSDDDIPPQFKGTLHNRRIAKIIEAAVGVQTAAISANPDRAIGALTVPEFSLLIESQLARFATALAPRDILRDVQLLLLTDLRSDAIDSKKEELRIHLSKLIGMNLSRVSGFAETLWNYKGSVQTDTGTWQVFAMREDFGPGRDVYSGCVLLHARGDVISACAAAHWVGGRFDDLTLSEFHAVAGDPAFGKIIDVS